MEECQTWLNTESENFILFKKWIFMSYMHTKYVTGYWKIDHNVTLGQLLLLAQLIATLTHYPCTVALMG